MEAVCAIIFFLIVAIIGVWAWGVASGIRIDWRWQWAVKTCTPYYDLVTYIHEPMRVGDDGG
jgi:hypothetical protein